VNGLLLVDKPAGPTSHDVVARLRRSSGERRIGHTGTLDPRATGLLTLVLGRATRLASLLVSSDKTYEAAVRLGYATTTDDEEGEPTTARANVLPNDDLIRTALESFAGTFEQVPPRHSAKRLGGRRAYELARRDEALELKPVVVTLRELEWLGRTGDIVSFRVVTSAGFYVRALARDLGAQLGCGGHLASLRRTASGAYSLGEALGLDDAEVLGPDVARHLIRPADAVGHLPAVRATPSGVRRVTHGNPVGPEHLETTWVAELARASSVRVLDGGGELVAVAVPRGGALHPIVVLG
jgi:tRNA pseudouridine55 synthase